MRAMSVSALKVTINDVPSLENCTDDNVGGGRGVVLDKTANVCPEVYTTAYSAAELPDTVELIVLVPTVAVLLDAIEAEKDDITKPFETVTFAGTRDVIIPAEERDFRPTVVCCLG